MERRADFPALTSSPSAARRFLAEVLAGWDCDDALETAQLLVSELVGNAVQHARSSTRVTATLASGHLRVAVRDASPEPLVPRNTAPLAPNGRGLLILDRLADEWGVHGDHGGKVVWFELRTD